MEGRSWGEERLAERGEGPAEAGDGRADYLGKPLLGLPYSSNILFHIQIYRISIVLWANRLRF